MTNTCTRETAATRLARVASILPANVTPGALYRFSGDDWDSYDLTVTRAGREYPVAQLTVYDDTSRGILVMRHHDGARTAAQRAAWRALEDALGYPPLESWQTPRAWLAS